jgi:hypothetical protein
MREYHRRIISFLREEGAERVKIRHRNSRSHPRASFQWRGRQHAYTIAMSPGDRRAFRNAAAELRRYLNGVKNA